jgi:galactose-1-phosphate uridylyltransferase
MLTPSQRTAGGCFEDDSSRLRPSCMHRSIDLPRAQITETEQCYLCPGNQRAAGDSNPKYESTYVFVNDYSAVKEEQAEYEQPANDGSQSPGIHTLEDGH